MASVVNYFQAPYKTGSGMNYPVIIKAPPNIDDYIHQYEVKDDSELTIGSLCQLDTNNLLDLPASSSTIRPMIVLDTVHNKAVLEGHAVTPSKTATFYDGDKIDCALLVPGMIVSVKVAYAGGAEADILPGDSLKCGATSTNMVEKDATDVATRIGIALADCAPGNTLVYIAMLVV